jgi:hypothetical protein
VTVFFAGIFGAKVGGASGESLGAASVLSKHGVKIAYIPTWGSADKWVVDECKQRGWELHISSQRKLGDVPGLAGSYVLMFCNEKAAAAWKQFKELGCKLVSVPCMTFMLPGYRRAEFDVTVCQSEIQKKCLGIENAHVVRGYYEWDKVGFNPLPRKEGEPFVCGKLGRDAAAKWNPRLGEIYARIPNCRGLFMGVPENIKNQYRTQANGRINCLKKGQIPSEEFYKQIHVMLTGNDPKGGSHARENWPRVGLESMARGIPIVAENNGGWSEMIVHGKTGFVYDNENQAVEYASMLEKDDSLRLEMARAGRERLEKEICDSEEIWKGWKTALEL